MSEQKNERQYAINGAGELTPSSNEFIQSTIAQLRSERLGASGTVVDAIESRGLYSPTIDAGPDQTVLEQLPGGLDPLTLPTGSALRVVYSAGQLKAAKEAGVSRKARGELKALLKAA